jgi:hypothetical protein
VDVPDSSDDAVAFSASGAGQTSSVNIAALQIASMTVSNAVHSTDLAGNTLTLGTLKVIGSAVAATNSLTVANGGSVVVTGLLQVGAAAAATGEWDNARVAFSGDTLLQIGASTDSRAALRIGYVPAYPSAARLVTGKRFNGYLSELLVAKRFGVENTEQFCVLDLSAVTNPAVLDIASSVEIAVGRNNSAVVTLSDSVSLRVGSASAPAGRFALASGGNKSTATPDSRFVVGAGNVDIYVADLSIGTDGRYSVGLFNATRSAGGAIDVSGNLRLGVDGAQDAAGEMLLSDGIDVRIGKDRDAPGGIVIGKSSMNRSSTLTLGAGRFEAYVTNLIVGPVGPGFQASTNLLDASRVSAGILDISDSVAIGTGRNETGRSLVMLSPAFATTVGAESRRATLAVASGFRPGIGRLIAKGRFFAYLSDLAVGCNTYAGDNAAGLLDLSGLGTGIVDVAGSAILGAGANAVGEVRLSSCLAHAANLVVGVTNAGSHGTLIMTGTVFAVSSSVTVDGPTVANKGRILNTVSGHPGGLDLGATASLAVSQGVINVTFFDPLRDYFPYWGLRWAGNHTNELNALAAAGKLTWSESGIDNADVVGPASILLLGDVTYLAIPMRLRSGTLFMLH